MRINAQIPYSLPILIVAFLMSLLAPFSAPGVTMKVCKTKEEEMIILQNRFVKLKIQPSKGGRISSLIDKREGVELVYWRKGKPSGLLDDKSEFTVLPYHVSTLKKSVRKCSATLTGTAGDLRITKTISLIEGEPALRIVYNYTNISDRKLYTSHMVRNFFLPGGGADENDRYYWTDKNGLATGNYPFAKTGRYFKVSAPWFAALDTKKRSGAAWFIDSNELDSFYLWMDHRPANPSFEWTINLDLKPKQSLRVPMIIPIIRQMSGISSVNDNAVFFVKSSADNLSLSNSVELYPLQKSTAGEKAVIWFDYLDADKHSIGGEAGIYLNRLEPGGTSTGSTTYHLPKPGKYIVAVKAKREDDGTILADCEFTVKIGDFKENDSGGSKFTTIAKNATALEKEKGFILEIQGERLPLKSPAPIDLAMGIDEYESLRIGIVALRDLGNVKIKIEHSTLPINTISVNKQNGYGKYSGKILEKNEYAIVPGDTIRMSSGDMKSFWLRFAGKEAHKGTYKLTILIRTENNQRVEIPISLTIYDIPLNLSNARLVTYHTLKYLMTVPHYGCLKEHLNLLSLSKSSTLMLFFDFKIWKNAIKTTRNSKGILRFDFSRLDTLLQPALKYKFKYVELMYTLCRKEWLKLPSGEDLSDNKKVVKKLCHALVDHLMNLGFLEVWVNVMDEPSIEYALSDKNLKRLREIKEIHPKLKLATTMNHYSSKLITKLNPYIDVWIPSYSAGICERLLNEKSNDVVKVNNDDLVGFYEQGRFFSSQASMRAKGWQAAYSNVDFFAIFAYNQAPNNPDWQLFACDKAGVLGSTPALEGLRDGFEDFSYWRIFDELLEKSVGKIGKLSQTQLGILNRCKKFKSKVFGKLISMRRERGGHGGEAWMKIENPSAFTFQKIKSQLLANISILQTILNKKNRK